MSWEREIIIQVENKGWLNTVNCHKAKTPNVVNNKCLLILEQPNKKWLEDENKQTEFRLERDLQCSNWSLHHPTMAV